MNSLPRSTIKEPDLLVNLEFRINRVRMTPVVVAPATFFYDDSTYLLRFEAFLDYRHLTFKASIYPMYTVVSFFKEDPVFQMTSHYLMNRGVWDWDIQVANRFLPDRSLKPIDDLLHYRRTEDPYYQVAWCPKGQQPVTAAIAKKEVCVKMADLLRYVWFADDPLLINQGFMSPIKMIDTREIHPLVFQNPEPPTKGAQ